MGARARDRRIDSAGWIGFGKEARVHTLTKTLMAVTGAVLFLPGAVGAQSGRAVNDGAHERPQADSIGARSRGWLDAGLGAGRVYLQDTPSDPGVSFALDFSGGLWLESHVGIGVRLGGWTLEGFNLSDPSEGESLSEAFVVFRLRPVGIHPLVLNLEGGWVSYTANDPAMVLREGDGLGGRVGVGWNLPVSDSWVIAPALVGSLGRIRPDSGLEPRFRYWAVGILIRAGWGW